MFHCRAAWLLAATLASSCESYSPEPVDLSAHAREFAARLPDAESIRAFVQSLGAAATPGEDTGVDLAAARLVALWFNPDLRAARKRAGVAEAAAAHAGTWPDPVLGADVTRILEDVAHPWLAGASLGLTVPLTGGAEIDLAASQEDEARTEARIAEATVLDQLDTAWTHWSALQRRAELLAELSEQLQGLEAIAAALAQAQEVTAMAARTFTLERLQRRAELQRAEAAAAAAALELKRLLGLPPQSQVPFVATLRVESRAPDAAARPQAVLDGPRVALAQGQHLVAERALALAIDRQWPEFTLLPGFEEEDAQPRAAFGISLPLPLWNRNAREIAVAKAQRDVAAEQLRGDAERALQDLARAELQAGAALAQRELVERELLPLAQLQIEDSRRLADLGRLDTLLILDGITRSHAAKALALDAVLAEAEAVIATNSLFWPTSTAPGPTEARR